MKTKYTKELLEPIVKESVSMREVLHKLDLKQTGGTHSYIKKVIKKHNLDYSHFLGKAANRGNTAQNKKHWSHYLVLDKNGYRQKACILRRSLIESGVLYKCVFCENNGNWRGNEMTLEVDHINGNFLDNRRDNLQFLCPNCHSQKTLKDSRERSNKSFKMKSYSQQYT